MSDHHVLKCHWKSGSSNRTMGDTFGSQDNLDLKDGEIIIDGRPTARIRLRQYFPYADNKIIVENIESSELVIYFEKGCH